MDTDTIDALLERYLHLLHEYTALREQLGALQAGAYQSIARANFAAERGMRYGQDHYDERMQASRRVRIVTAPASLSSSSYTSSGQSTAAAAAAAAATFTTASLAVAAPCFTIIREEDSGSPPSPPKPSTEEEGAAVAETQGSGADGSSKREEEQAAEDEGSEKKTKPAGDKEEEKQTQAQRDPLRWFGLLAPMALRQAQAQSVQAVEQVIPRLVSVDAEMARVEIEVRRARKKRTKAEMAAVKKEQQQQQESIGSTEIAT